MSKEKIPSAIGVTPVDYFEGFVSNDSWFDTLWNDLDWIHRTPRRREYWTNDLSASYTYGTELSGGSYDSQPTHPIIEEVKGLLEPIVGFRYNACFLNGYSESRSGLEWHSDNSPNIDHTRPIAIVTLGEGRAIQLKEIGGSQKYEVFLEEGSLMLMRAGCQQTHLHRIPKAGYQIKRPRVSLTFRSLL